jgi:hypothetical protein
MATALRRTGIGVVGDMPWGSHFCLFYETKDDLLETVVAYSKAGLEDYEFLHVRAPHEGRDVGGVTTYPARSRPARVRPEHRDVPPGSGNLKGGKFDLGRLTAAWNSKLDGTLARGSPA